MAPPCVRTSGAGDLPAHGAPCASPTRSSSAGTGCPGGTAVGRAGGRPAPRRSAQASSSSASAARHGSRRRRRGPRRSRSAACRCPGRLLYDGVAVPAAARRSQRATGPVDVHPRHHASSSPPRTAPLVVTIHDLAFLHEPGHFTARGGARVPAAASTWCAGDADLVLCVVAGHAGRLRRAPASRLERLRLVPLGVDRRRRSTTPT